ncbi:hypothetical protein IT570_14275 [Candidatus Sumerlaeota bacterium]|nr:hypothetical protein [Candidatus Sumerlaeota bacterium]
MKAYNPDIPPPLHDGDDNIRRRGLPVSPPEYYDLTNDFEGTLAHLSNADSAWLYHIFRERREAAGWSSPIILSHIRYHIAMVMQIALFGVLLATYFTTPLILFLGWLCVLLFKRLFSVVSASFQTEDNSLPLYVEQLAFGSRIHSCALLDLYLTGVQGRHLAEAYFLECMEKLRLFTRTTYAVGALTICTVLVLIVGARSYVGLITCICLLAGALACAKWILPILAVRLYTSKIRSTNRRWKVSPDDHQPTIFAIEWILRPKVMHCLLIGGLAVLLQVANFIVPCFPILPIILLIVVYLSARNDYPKYWQQLVHETSIAFSIFITTKLNDDDLGTAWAKWYHGRENPTSAVPDVIVLSQEFEPAEAPATLPMPPPTVSRSPDP